MSDKVQHMPIWITRLGKIMTSSFFFLIAVLYHKGQLDVGFVHYGIFTSKASNSGIKTLFHIQLTWPLN